MQERLLATEKVGESTPWTIRAWLHTFRAASTAVAITSCCASEFRTFAAHLYADEDKDLLEEDFDNSACCCAPCVNRRGRPRCVVGEGTVSSAEDGDWGEVGWCRGCSLVHETVFFGLLVSTIVINVVFFGVLWISSRGPCLSLSNMLVGATGSALNSGAWVLMRLALNRDGLTACCVCTSVRYEDEGEDDVAVDIVDDPMMGGAEASASDTDSDENENTGGGGDGGGEGAGAGASGAVLVTGGGSRSVSHAPRSTSSAGESSISLREPSGMETAMKHPHGRFELGRLSFALRNLMRAVSRLPPVRVEAARALEREASMGSRFSTAGSESGRPRRRLAAGTTFDDGELHRTDTMQAAIPTPPSTWAEKAKWIYSPTLTRTQWWSLVGAWLFFTGSLTMTFLWHLSAGVDGDNPFALLPHIEDPVRHSFQGVIRDGFVPLTIFLSFYTLSTFVFLLLFPIAAIVTNAINEMRYRIIQILRTAPPRTDREVLGERDLALILSSFSSIFRLTTALKDFVQVGVNFYLSAAVLDEFFTVFASVSDPVFAFGRISLVSKVIALCLDVVEVSFVLLPLAWITSSVQKLSVAVEEELGRPAPWNDDENSEPAVVKADGRASRLMTFLAFMSESIPFQVFGRPVTLAGIGVGIFIFGNLAAQAWSKLSVPEITAAEPGTFRVIPSPTKSIAGVPVCILANASNSSIHF